MAQKQEDIIFLGLMSSLIAKDQLSLIDRVIEGLTNVGAPKQVCVQVSREIDGGNVEHLLIVVNAYHILGVLLLEDLSDDF